MKKEKIIIILMVLTLAVSFTVSSVKNDLESKITRLHILANSDSNADQLLKIKVRDAIINETDILTGGYTKERIDDELLMKIENIARKTIRNNGFDYDADAYFTNMYFDTRVYDGFAIPCGYYDAVRVEIGKGEGKNWWCVLFPPLCAPLAGENIEDVAKEAGLSDDDIGIITKDGEVYAIRFKAAELIGKIKHLFDNRPNS